MNRSTARLLRYAITAARSDYKRSRRLVGDQREDFLARMFRHGGYLYGLREQQVYVIALNRLLTNEPAVKGNQP